MFSQDLGSHLGLRMVVFSLVLLVISSCYLHANGYWENKRKASPWKIFAHEDENMANFLLCHKAASATLGTPTTVVFCSVVLLFQQLGVNCAPV
ncbi:MAG: hypothetical protein ACSLEM_02265 [Candidatus Malihini olakiniferum]